MRGASIGGGGRGGKHPIRRQESMSEGALGKPGRMPSWVVVIMMRNRRSRLETIDGIKEDEGGALNACRAVRVLHEGGY